MYKNNPYSVQFNSDPRPLHQTSNRFMSNNDDKPPPHYPSHPYITAQNNKKSNNNNNNGRFQGIGSKLSSNNSALNNKRNRKRKFIETFEDDEDGQYQYDQSSLILTPKRKKHITEQTVMKSIRNTDLIHTDNIDLNSIHDNFNELSLNSNDHNSNSSKPKHKTKINGKKRTLNDLINDEMHDIQCKDKINGLLSNSQQIGIKKMKIWDPINNTIFAYNTTNNDYDYQYIENEEKQSMNTNNNNNNDTSIDEQIKSELIPSIIQYAEFMNNNNDDNNNPFINKLYRVDSILQRRRLNKYNGALVKYSKPHKSWQDLIQRYYKNNKHCDVLQFTKMENVMNNDGNGECNDFEMNEKNEKNEKKKKRPIRLHPSYTGFTKNEFINSEELKKIANQCYVSTLKNNNKNINMDDDDNNDDSMDCD